MWNLMRELLRDVRQALRVLRRRPSYALITILTLTIGIGAVAAAFTVLHGVVLRPLPFRDADRLAVLWSIDLKQPDDRDPLRLADILAYPQQTRVLEGVAYFRFWGLTLTGSGGDPEELVTARVSPNFLSLAGAQPMLGEGFRSSHGEAGNDKVVILAHKARP
jgi:putative ABC transport system permease protein